MLKILNCPLCGNKLKTELEDDVLQGAITLCKSHEEELKDMVCFVEVFPPTEGKEHPAPTGRRVYFRDNDLHLVINEPALRETIIKYRIAWMAIEDFTRVGLPDFIKLAHENAEKG